MHSSKARICDGMGCTNTHGTGNLHIWKGYINAEWQKQVLKQHMLPSRRNIFQRRSCKTVPSYIPHTKTIYLQRLIAVVECEWFLFINCRAVHNTAHVMLTDWECRTVHGNYLYEIFFKCTLLPFHVFLPSFFLTVQPFSPLFTLSSQLTVFFLSCRMYNLCVICKQCRLFWNKIIYCLYWSCMCSHTPRPWWARRTQWMNSFRWLHFWWQGAACWQL